MGSELATSELARALNLSERQALQLVAEVLAKLRRNAREMGIEPEEVARGLHQIRVPDGARVKTAGDGRFVDESETAAARATGRK